MADVARVHDDEALRQAGARAPTRCRAAAARTLDASPQFGITRIRSGGDALLLERAASSCRRSRPRGRPSAATGRRAAAARRTTTGLRSRPSLTAISGKTSCAITSSGARKRAATTRAIAPTNGGSVMQTTRSGRRANRPFQSDPEHVRQVVQARGATAASARTRSSGRGRSATPFRSCWAGGLAARRAGDHGHVVVGGERLAELGQEVGGRLDAGPVVLVQDENALPAHGRTGYPRDQADRGLAADRSDRLEPVTAGTGTAALTSTAVTDIAVLGPDPGFGGGGAAQLEAFLVAAAAPRTERPSIHYGRMPSRQPAGGRRQPVRARPEGRAAPA